MNGRFNLFGVEISCMSLKDINEFISSYDFSKKGYICLPDTYVITLAEGNPTLRNILNQSIVTLPDGKPIEWYARLIGSKDVRTISGYWLLRSLLKPGISHYFYGADIVTLQRILRILKRNFPDSIIRGFRAPPIMTLEEIPDNPVIDLDFQEINLLGPDIIWVGISSPKQDFLMAHYQDKLQRGIMIGVGGVFDYLAETTRISPEWMKKIGLRWLYRLMQEPGRLWKKYFFTFSRFFILLISESFNVKKHQQDQDDADGTI